MGRHRKDRTLQRLYYNDIRLVPVNINEHPWCLQRDKYADSWHLPGGEIVTRKQLVARAEARGASLVLHEVTDGHARAVLLT